MDTVYVVEGADGYVGRHRSVYSNRETAIQIYNNVCHEFATESGETNIKEAESFKILEIDEGFIRFANLSDTEYIGVYIKEININPPKP